MHATNNPGFVYYVIDVSFKGCNSTVFVYQTDKIVFSSSLHGLNFSFLMSLDYFSHYKPK